MKRKVLLHFRPHFWCPCRMVLASRGSRPGEERAHRDHRANLSSATRELRAPSRRTTSSLGKGR